MVWLLDISAPKLMAFLSLKRQVYVNDAREIWDKMKALEKTDKEGHHMTHDGNPL